MFAQHWDHVDDQRNISGASRFISGGIGGITSQLCELNGQDLRHFWCEMKISSHIPHRNFENPGAYSNGDGDGGRVYSNSFLDDEFYKQ